MQESHAASLVGEVKEMEIVIGEELLWHNCLQVSLLIDLKKNLSAFPLQVYGQYSKARVRL